MKKTILTAISFLLISNVFALPFLNSNNTIPIIGETFHYNGNNVAGDPGLDGANQTWNLNTLGNTQQYTASVLSSAGSSYPNSTYKVTFSTGGEFYYSSTANDLSLVGISTTSVNFPFNDPEQQLSFPMSYGTTFTDNWSTVFTNGMTYYRNGFTNVTADSYGTLILPSGTFNDILRVKVTQDYSDSVPGNGVIYSYLNTTYYYYQPGVHMYLAIITELISVDNLGNVTQSNSTGYLNSVPAGVNEFKSASILVYPNPSIDKFTVNVSNTSFEHLTFIMIDMSGKPISMNIVNLGSEYRLEPKVASSGTYWLNVYADDRTIGTKKIQMVH